MKRYVYSAEYKKYNANNRGTNAPDCVKRAISLAFDVDYNKISRLLLDKAAELNKSWQQHTVFEPVIYSLGGSKRQLLDSPSTVADFIDHMSSNNSYILETSPKPAKATYGNHLTCVINGQLFDSWNSLDQYVCSYYIVSAVTHTVTDLPDHLTELFADGTELIRQLSDKYISKYHLSGEFNQSEHGSEVIDFALRYLLSYTGYADEHIRDKSWYLNCVFSPTMSVEDARKKMTNVIKTRMYDCFYAINNEIAANRESNDLFHKSGYTDEDAPKLHLSSLARRFYSSLPNWCKPFILSIDIDHPGQNRYSYDVWMLPILDDPEKPDEVHFYGYDSAMIKEELQIYKDSYERVGLHYEAGSLTSW